MDNPQKPLFEQVGPHDRAEVEHTFALLRQLYNEQERPRDDRCFLPAVSALRSDEPDYELTGMTLVRYRVGVYQMLDPMSSPADAFDNVRVLLFVGTSPVDADLFDLLVDYTPGLRYIVSNNRNESVRQHYERVYGPTS